MDVVAPHTEIPLSTDPLYYQKLVGTGVASFTVCWILYFITAKVMDSIKDSKNYVQLDKY